MAVHHFIATGRDSERLLEAAANSDRLIAQVSGMVADHGLHVMEAHAVGFPGGGLTVVWILAESHLVLHHWRPEGYITLDLHVCDYRSSNVERARNLAAELGRFCYRPGTDAWRQVVLEDPLDVSAASGL